MKMMLNLAFLLVLLNLLPYPILSLSTAFYRKTEILLDTFDAPFLLNASYSYQVNCMLTCLNNVDCRRLLVCQDQMSDVSVCYHYQDGENCVARTTTIQNKDCQCFSKEIQVNDGATFCPIGNYGNDCEMTIRDCNEGKLKGLAGTMLSYIKPGTTINEELCNFDNGYTTIQVRRQDVIEVDFNRTWSEYVNGFGLSHTEHWLGLRNIYDLTNGGTSFKLEMVIHRDGFPECIFTFTHFRLADTIFYNAQYFQKSAACSFGVFPLIVQNNKFSTNDNLNANVSNCHSPLTGGWWLYNTPTLTDCQGFNLNRLRSELKFNNVLLQYVTLRLAPM